MEWDGGGRIGAQGQVRQVGADGAPQFRQHAINAIPPESSSPLEQLLILVTAKELAHVQGNLLVVTGLTEGKRRYSSYCDIIVMLPQSALRVLLRQKCWSIHHAAKQRRLWGVATCQLQ